MKRLWSRLVVEPVALLLLVRAAIRQAEERGLMRFYGHLPAMMWRVEFEVMREADGD